MCVCVCVCVHARAPSPVLEFLHSTKQSSKIMRVNYMHTCMFSRILMLSIHKISNVKLLTSFYLFVFCTYVNCFGLLCLQYLNTISSKVCYSLKPTFMKQKLLMHS